MPLNQPATPTSAPVSILVVTADRTCQRKVVDALTQVGYRLVTATSGVEATAAFASQPTDAVLLDPVLPGMDGFAVSKALRKLAGGDRAIILALVENHAPEQTLHANEATLNDFVSKHCDHNELLARLRFCLRRQRASDSLQADRDRARQAQAMAQLGYWDWHEGRYITRLAGEVERWLADAFPSQPDIPLADFLAQVHPDDRQQVSDTLEQALSSGSGYEIEYRLQRPGGQDRLLHERARPAIEAGTGEHRLFSVALDISEMREAERQIHHLAFYDRITGLPNRSLLEETLERALRQAKRQERGLALCMLDLDDFKRVNESLGHGAGDQVLREMTKRLSTELRGSDHSFRAINLGNNTFSMGGDEFVVLLADLAAPEDAAKIAQRIQGMVTRPFHINEHDINLTASIGISLYPNSSDDTENLIRHADTAMHDVKTRGGNSYRFYSAEAHQRARRRLSLETRLRRALDRGELFLAYQPQIDLSTHTVAGVEALVRWHDDERGMISPAEFIPVAESTGLILPLSDFVLTQGCQDAARLCKLGFPDIEMGVNLSAVQFTQPDLADRIDRLRRDYRLGKRNLMLELTEGMLIKDTEQSIAILERLKENALRLAVDDFGTGYSSLQYLKRFPVSALKIDRSFVRDLVINPEDIAILKAIVALAEHLNLETVAEGVEEQAQLERLEELGCHKAQGFLFAPALPWQELVEWLQGWRQGA